MLTHVRRRLAGDWLWIFCVSVLILLLAGLVLPALGEPLQTNSLAVGVAHAWLSASSDLCGVLTEWEGDRRRTAAQEYLLGGALVLCDQADAAVQRLDSAMSDPMRHRQVAVALARLYEREGRWDLAASSWNEAGASALYATDYLHRARLAFVAGDDAVGEQMTRAAALLEPTSALPYRLLATVYRGKDNDKMLGALRAGLERDAVSAWSYTARGLILEFGPADDRGGALACYREALNKDPADEYAAERLEELEWRISRSGGERPVQVLACPDESRQDR